MNRIMKWSISFLLSLKILDGVAQPSAGPPTQLFFVFHTDSGTLVAQHDQAQHYILTLNQVPREVTYFSDQPQPLVGSIVLNRLTIAASQRVNNHFHGALSFSTAASARAPLQATIINVDHYVFIARNDQIIAQVTLLNPQLHADRYEMKRVLLETDGMWFLPQLLAHS